MSPLSTHFLTMLLFIHLPDGYVNLPRLAYPQKMGCGKPQPIQK